MPKLFWIFAVCALIADRYGFWYGISVVGVEACCLVMFGIAERYHAKLKGGNHGP